MEVRPLALEDCATAAQVTATASEGWSQSALEETLSSPAGRLYGLWEDSRLEGVAIFQQVLEEVSLEGITLLPSCRGKGLGKFFLSRCLELLKNQGGALCFLEVRSLNAPALVLYESMGFQPMGKRKNFYRNPPDDALTYRLEF